MKRAPRHVELTPYERRRLHEEACLIAATFSEFFPDAPRPAPCAFNTRPVAKPGTLTGLMQANAR